MNLIDKAIARSASHNEIVHISIADIAAAGVTREDAVTELSIACDDHVEGNVEHEFWGTTEGGAEWRVHVAL